MKEKHILRQTKIEVNSFSIDLTCKKCEKFLRDLENEIGGKSDLH
jgi:hypothetical protein